MVQKIEVSGYEEFKKKVKETLKDNEKVQLNILFTGQKDSKGRSWCPDCNNAEPYLNKALEEHGKKDSIFMVVQVGDRSFWKDLKNPFRSDRDAHVSVIPTLIRWKSPARLDGDLCAKKSLLEMFFKEDDEEEEEVVQPKRQKPKPTEKPIEKPVKKSFKKPVDGCIENSNEKPVEKPAENLVEKPVETPGENIVEEPIETSIENSAENVIEKPIEKPAENLVEKPSKEPVEKPVETPAEKPTEKPKKKKH